MGKGKGKFVMYGLNLYKGSKLFTFWNFRLGKLLFYKKRFEKYFGCALKINV